MTTPGDKPQESAGPPDLPPIVPERIRHILTGGSVVDWSKLNLATIGDVNDFLRVNELDPEDSRDMARIRTMRDRAADYLRIEHRYRLPPELVTGDPRDLFAYAAGVKGRRNTRLFACMLLKTIHVIHHLEARELGQHLPLSQAEVGHLLEAKVTDCVQRLRALSYRIVDFSGGQKSRTSLITKLLAKKETLATQVHDRVRFRLVVEEQQDLPQVIDALTRYLFPFNYVVPNQAQNDLIDLSKLGANDDASGAAGAPARYSGIRMNEFSGATYRVINFVVDMPLRVPPEVLALRGHAEDLGRVIFALAEVQLVDAAAARANEQGENNHHEYKNRQRQRVRMRLEQGDAVRHRDGAEE